MITYDHRDLVSFNSDNDNMIGMKLIRDNEWFISQQKAERSIWGFSTNRWKVASEIEIRKLSNIFALEKRLLVTAALFIYDVWY